MTAQKKYGPTIVNLLIATAISLVVNFSYFIYALTPSGNAWTQRNWGVEQTIPQGLFAVIQVAFYIVLAMTLLTILTRPKQRNYVTSIVWCIAVTAGFFLIAPSIDRETGGIVANISLQRLSNSLLLRLSFTLVVSVLYGVIYDLVYQRQMIRIENERLKNENLQSRYNMLVSQINPHFLFNSLNSLAMLVREKQNPQALDYIDRMSDTFRYIIGSSQNGMTPLFEELRFLEAYKYLLEVRYDGKLFFDIEVPEEYRNRTLPAMTLQPLIENAVKHNTISSVKPLRISIRIEEGNLVVANPIQPKVSPEPGTGIGISNLKSRFNLLTGKEVEISTDDGVFCVILPLTDTDEAHTDH